MSDLAKSSSPKIYFVRHGETDWNVAGRMQGHQDIALNDKGRYQAEQVGRKLAKLVAQPAQLPHLVSPMRRTWETADIMLRTMGLSTDICSPEPRLKELTFGQWEGLTWKEVRSKDPERAARRDIDKWGTVPPEGDSYAMLAERIRPVFASLQEDAVIVSHGGVARAALVVMGCVAQEQAPLIDIWQGRILVISNGSYQWV